MLHLMSSLNILITASLPTALILFVHWWLTNFRKEKGMRKKRVKMGMIISFEEQENLTP